MGAGVVVLAAVIAAAQGVSWFGIQKLAQITNDEKPAPQPSPVAENAGEPTALASDAAAATRSTSTAAVTPKPTSASPLAGGAQVPDDRVFESTDVDEEPAVATRVEPKLPRNVPARVNDIVVVRLLVSQRGQPTRVTLLRRSKHGQAVDDAVAAAVSQWRFSPARKRGEAVACWYNVAVPLGQAD